MGRPNELHVSIKAWLIIAALAGPVWGLNALIEGSSDLIRANIGSPTSKKGAPRAAIYP
jgi:hypothetical protein